MEKKQYLENKLKRDFLRDSLLQEDSLPAGEIADKLYGTVSFSDIINEGKEQIDLLCDKYLSFDSLKVSGDLSDQLPVNYEIEVKDRMTESFQTWLDSKANDSLLASALGVVRRNIERQTWSNGIVNMSEAIDYLISRFRSSSLSYSRLEEIPSDSVLLEKYANAKNRTFIEKMSGGNVDDIIEYRNALKEYVTLVCHNALYSKVSTLYSELSAAPLFNSIKANFKSFEDYAHSLQQSLTDAEPVAAWDKEYDRIVPTDFYCRNVENITPEYAFQMVLLQFFAHNEDWMLANGLLANGELQLFTTPSNHLSALASKLGEMVSDL